MRRSCSMSRGTSFDLGKISIKSVFFFMYLLVFLTGAHFHLSSIFGQSDTLRGRLAPDAGLWGGAENEARTEPVYDRTAR